MLDGYRTYIFGALSIAVGICGTMGLLTTEQVISMLGIFAGAGGMAMRSAVKAVEKKADEVREEQINSDLVVRSFMSTGQTQPLASEDLRNPFVPSTKRAHDR